MSNTLELLPETDLSFKVKRIVAHLIAMDEDQITDSASFENDLGVDSLDVLEIMMEVEKKFGINIPDEDAEKLTTVESLIRYVKAKQR
ncbi:MAG TPA: acyl carrier protein [Ferruginibacter sp.]|jgi:acyl carrier protein|nr:acyl carrier protein [Ferruginibacter sp.]